MNRRTFLARLAQLAGATAAVPLLDLWPQERRRSYFFQPGFWRPGPEKIWVTIESMSTESGGLTVVGRQYFQVEIDKLLNAQCSWATLIPAEPEESTVEAFNALSDHAATMVKNRRVFG